ncbi:MAG TPA: BTAD domain-containing putative transcriptional regulator [Coriobacteriia bacterium]|jgi:DNA-binding SARP family transcriptional activator
MHQGLSDASPRTGDVFPRTSEPGTRDAVPRYTIGLIGAFSLHHDAQIIRPARSAQRLLAYLALREPPLLRSHVAGTLWPDAMDDRAMGNLRSTLWRVRKLPGTLVVANGEELALAPDVAVDVRVLGSLALHLIDRPDEPAVSFADDRQTDVEALAVASDLLADWSDDWLLVERERFRQLRLHALERLCGLLATAGRFGRAVEMCLAAVSGEPLRESAHRQLIEVHLAEGNRVEALRQYEAYRQLMRDELGLGPSPHIVNLVTAIIE